jgi:hypothetical protein
MKDPGHHMRHIQKKVMRTQKKDMTMSDGMRDSKMNKMDTHQHTSVALKRKLMM